MTMDVTILKSLRSFPINSDPTRNTVNGVDLVVNHYTTTDPASADVLDKESKV